MLQTYQRFEIFIKIFAQINIVRIFANTKFNMMEKISENNKQLARFAKALGHPIRVYILELLNNQACCYSGDLSEDVPVAKSTLSQHLKELKSAGLIKGEIEGPKVKYCINRENWGVAKYLFRDLLGE